MFHTIDNGGHGYYDRVVGSCPEELAAFTSERVFVAAPLGSDRIILGDILTAEVDKDSAVGLLRPKRSICDAP